MLLHNSPTPSTRWMRMIALVLVLAGTSLAARAATAADRPNFVWIMSEDNSKHYLRHFDPDGAPAPNIEALAEHGITFDRAFSCAPVCSVARTTLITACYAPRIGTQFHRRSKLAAMPEGLKMFPAYLRDAGYYTTNNSKEDYNAVRSPGTWDDSSKKASWKKRPDKSMPFFHVVTSALSHEGRLHFSEKTMANPTQTDPESVKLQPYFPDTDTFRYTRASYHDRMMAIDKVVGDVVEELKNAGELENTFIFYFGDHGGVLPRSKGYTYEAGLHVPLVVRVPERWNDRVSREVGSRTNGFVEFVDFGPTVLNLAGIDVPRGVDGKAFLGDGIGTADVDARNETFGYADRFDEKYDLVRTLRIGNIKYMRHFEPYYPDGMQNNYRYKMLAYQQWRELHAEGKLNDVQSQFYRPKAVEAIYNLENDPHETRNLAGDPNFQATLKSMRTRLDERLKAMPDLSFFPEAMLYESAMANPTEFGQQNKERIAKLIDTANLALLPFDESEEKLRDAISSNDPWVRYWGWVAASSIGSDAKPLIPIAKNHVSDEEPLVALRAIEFMAIIGDEDIRPQLYQTISRASNEPELLQMLNTAVYLNDFFGDRLTLDVAQLKSSIKLSKQGDIQDRLDYFSSK
ncbi:sulfatase atsG [Rhodopirellula maiorica SM1]|uniref:Sulfatase atsG n=1 Tax=Rhodopirellula maiorica SM1 TaxID=1265738 RepID=M5RRJ3_9BACT|nr:sulfatase-like hydrolase/transferase [Rhodopirellula maiorica]EMI16589.1 sulfatase atsG [Rhodopirellula maiorica SM1]